MVVAFDLKLDLGCAQKFKHLLFVRHHRSNPRRLFLHDLLLQLASEFLFFELRLAFYQFEAG